MEKDTFDLVQEPLNKAPHEIQNIITRVLQAEKDKLYQDKPRVVDDLVEIIKEEIKDETPRA